MLKGTHKVRNPKSNATTNGAGPLSKRRTKTGSSLLELPLALWLIFVLMLLPMMWFATLTLKSALAAAATQNAAQAAAKAKTFQVGLPGKQPAQFVAILTAIQSSRMVPDLVVAGVDCDILRTPIGGGPVTRFENKLTEPADTSQFIYQIETEVIVIVQPLIKLSPELFGFQPGVTMPMIARHNARAMAENPQGLNQ